ncbi:methyltransferase, FkbM family [Bryocella elongata]|uniref:Methyltransferase, FkbM family n=1 Tax=Bryocella elongata TaxID=863522 RepID=A0A1H5Y931_9BACT|nr:FkbM family methyltransferase [Bryocella elongata]SEG20589.1 methyltransferase, FkbM family [Bryocella elongata]
MQNVERTSQGLKARQPGGLAQLSFDAELRLSRASHGSPFPLNLVAKVARRVVAPLARSFGSRRTVKCVVYGQSLQMPAEHPLPGILVVNPQYNRPLALTAQAIAAEHTPSSMLAAVDVGANIGDTVAILEEALPGRFAYLCIEPEEEIAGLCTANHEANSRVVVTRAFVGEQEGAEVYLEDDGRANPTTRVAAHGVAMGTLRRLDSLALPFVESRNGLALIKVDTEGFDFAVLRSGVELLRRYHPVLFFEWFPRLLQEDPLDGLRFLNSLGYEHMVFFTNRGDFYCAASGLQEDLWASLLLVTSRVETIPYFDVAAMVDRSTRDALISRC